MKYKKIPVEIEAIQWNGTTESRIEISKFMGVFPTYVELTRGHATNLIIDTIEGSMEARVGDFIIKGVKGEFYPCKPDIFFTTYERV